MATPDRIAAALADYTGSAVAAEELQIHPDPQVPDVYAVRFLPTLNIPCMAGGHETVEAPNSQDEDWLTGFLVRVPDAGDTEVIDEVEFKRWPPQPRKAY